MTETLELTIFTKENGPLTKRICLTADGSVKSDGSACVMSRGTAQRLRVANVGEFATVIDNVRPDQAIALGALRSELPDKVDVVTKHKLNRQPNVIARTSADIVFRKEKPALALIDFDIKGMPPELAAEMKRLGGFWPTLLSVLPPLRAVAHVSRCSTSAGLFRSDTGEQLPGSGGLHVYLSVRDGGDVERFLRALHERCWLRGFGWLMVGAGGQLLERSIIDRMVGAPERLIFEGGPILDLPLRQDRESRRPIPVDGDALDSITACPPLTILESAKLRELKAKQAHRLMPQSAKARAGFIGARAMRLAERTGISAQAAAQEIARQCEGVLLPNVELPWDDEDLVGCTVGDVLADPARFDGATLADPLEGIEYGTCKARIMRRADGTPWINSFAHGRSVYELKYNAATVRAAMDQAADDAAVKTFIKLALMADLSADEVEELRNEAARRSGVAKRTISNMLKAAQQERAAKQEQKQQRRRIAERQDPRPAISVPNDDSPWLPQMDLLNDVIGTSAASHPPARDIDGVAAFDGQIALPETHAFTSEDANAHD
jgi:hypothetical protein